MSSRAEDRDAERARDTSNRRARPGFTLIEVVTSSVIVGTVLMALASAVVLASRALPERGSAVDSRLQSATALDRMMSDVATAKRVITADANGIAFTISDRNGDLADESIEYRWSGIAGEPLTRRVNAGAAITMIPGVKRFSLGYRTRTVPVVTTVDDQLKSGDVVLSSWTDWIAVKGVASPVAVSPTVWVAQTFSLGVSVSRVVSMDIARVSVRMMRLNTTGQIRLSVHRAATPGSGIPDSTVLAMSEVATSSLPTIEDWVTFPIGALNIADPQSEFVVLVRGMNGASARATTMRSSNADATPAFRYSTASGTAWLPLIEPSDSQAMPLRVEGVYTYLQSRNVVTSASAVRGVWASVATGDDSTRMDAATDLVGDPLLGGP